MEHRFISLIVLAALLLTSAIEPLVWAGVATEQMRDTVDRVVAVMQDSRLKAAGGQAERRERLRQAIGARFDFNEMAKGSLGQNWQRGTLEEQREFVSLFAALLDKADADQIEALHGDKIVFGRERLEQNHAEVDSKIFTAKREDFSVNYKLLPPMASGKSTTWASAMSLINNYRSQFNRILAKGSFAALLRAMRGGPDTVGVK